MVEAEKALLQPIQRHLCLKLAVGWAVWVRAGAGVGHRDLVLIPGVVAATVRKRQDASAAEASEDTIAPFIEHADLPRLARFQGCIDELVSQRPVEKPVSRKLQRRLHGIGKETVLTLLFRRKGRLPRANLRLPHGF
jgi:hypothetical protein